MSNITAITNKYESKAIDIISNSLKFLNDNNNNNNNNNSFNQNNNNFNDDNNNYDDNNYDNNNNNCEDNNNEHIKEPPNSPHYWSEEDDEDLSTSKRTNKMFSFLNDNDFLQEEEIEQNPIIIDKIELNYNKFLPSETEYNIMTDIDLLMKSKMLNETFVNVRKDGHNIPLYDGSQRTVKDFNEKLLHILRLHQARPDLIVSIYETLMEEMPFLNIPCYLTSHGNKKITILDDEIDVHKYPDSIHVITYDCCKGGCMVYTDFITKTCKNDKCLVQDRFKPCVLCSDQTLCNHSNRIPYKQFKYRSIKLLLIELIKFQSFRDLIKFQFYRPDRSKTYDMSDRQSYQQNQQEMFQKYREYCRSVNKEATDVIEVSIISSWFSDGVQLFDKVLCDFVPIMLSIDSLPPSLRDIIGVGTFILTFMTFKEHSGVEEFFYKKCFLPELLDLNNGFAYEDNGKHYFLQLRVLGHIADLKGLCNWLKIQTMHNSHAGCMICNNGKGKTIWFDKKSHQVKYIDSRLPLPEESFLRTFGLSRNCCPEEETNIEDEELNYSNNNNNSNHKQIGKANNSNYKRHQVDTDILDLCIDTKDKSRRRQLLEFLCKQSPNFIWFSDFLHTHFRDHLYYNHCEYRPMSSYKEFKTEDIINLIEAKKLNPRINNGVLEMSFVFYLPYFDYALHISVEPKHALKDFLFDFVFKRLWKNSETFITDNVNNYYAKYKETAGVKNFFPLLLDFDPPKCSFALEEQSSCELVLRCLLIPRGCSSKLKFADFKIFDHSAFISIDNVMTIFTTYMHLLLMCSHWMSNVYKLYYRILSDIICRINAPSQYIKNIDPLYWRTVEFRAITEGLFPVTVMTFMLHSLTCLTKQIFKRGPLSSWNGLYGETNVASVKRLVKVTGGSKYEQMAYKKQFNKEAEIMKEFYENFDIANNEYSLLLEKDSNIIYYNPAQSNVNETSLKNKLSAFEFDQLSFLIMTKIMNHFDNNVYSCIINSSYYRIIKFIEEGRINNETRAKCINRHYLKVYKIEYNFIYDTLITAAGNTIIEDKKHILKTYIEKFIDYIYSNKRSDEITYDCLIRLNQSLTINEYIQIPNKRRIVEYLGHVISVPTSKEFLNGHSNFIVRDISIEDYYTFQQIYEMINNLSISESSATINGIKFYGRGFQCSEKNYVMNSIIPSNEKNDLSKYWFDTQQSSSWCKIENDLYGQLNYFFKPPISNDKLVSNFYIASITCRRALIPDFNKDNINFPPINCVDLTIHSKRTETVPKSITRTGWNDTDVSFIEFNNILPTRVATIGLHKNGDAYIPIYCRQYNTDSQIQNLDKLINQNKISVVEGNRKIDYLGLIDVSPENLIEKEKPRIQNMIKYIITTYGRDVN